MDFRQLESDILPVIRYCYEGRALINLKCAMNAIGFDVGSTRRPLNIGSELVPTGILERIMQTQSMPSWSKK